MRKFTLFVASLFCFVGVLHAESLVADGVYKLSADVNQQRGELVAANDYNYPVLDGIDLSGYTQNSTAAKTNGQYWYVKSAGQGDNTYYLYNIAESKYLVNENGNVNFGDTPYVWTFVTNASKPDYLNIKDAARTSSVWLSSGCGRTAAQRPVQWDSNNNDGGALYTFTYVGNYFATPETGKYYKIKGEGELPWLTAEVTSGGNVVVSNDETKAAVFLKTANGLQAIATGKYLGYTGGKYTYSDAEITIELRNDGDYLANYSNKYAIVSGGNYMFNNNNDGIVHESNQALNLSRLWAFTEVENVVHIAGAGIEDNPYVIDNAEELILFRNSVNAGETTYNAKDAYVALGAGIDLADENWTGIGTEANPFVGVFVGNGNTISNLNILVAEGQEGKAYLGLFGYAKNATIKNLTITNVDINVACLDIDHSQGHIGAVAGSLEGTSTIENVTVNGDIKVYATQDANGASRVAVVAGGNAYGNVTMKNVHVNANEGSYLKANNNTGALAGQLQGKMVFENCSSNIDVTVNKFFAGGLVGIAAGDSEFKNCHTTGDVAVVAGRAGRGNDHYRVGGIAGGWADGKTKVCTLTDCSYTGNVSGVNADGSVAETLDYRGFVGRGYTLTNCAGSKVVIDGVEHVQAYDNVYGFYTVDGVYEVNTLAALKAVRDNVNTGADYYEGETIVLTADIDLTGENWVGIGSAYKDHGFMGNFDGKNFKIKNLTITDPAADSDGYVYAGLFSVTEGIDQNNQNTIENLTIENVTIKTTGHIVSAAIAYPYYTIVDNVNVCGEINITGGNYTAGALAYTRRCVNASDIIVAGNANSYITGAQVVGGVISDIQMNGGLKAEYSNFCVSGVSIEGTKMVGGISGIIATQTLNGATVENVTLTSGDNCVGIVSGSFGGTCTITDVTYNDVTGADVIIGHTYSKDGPGAAVEAKIGDTYYSTLAEAVKGTGNVELLTDVTLKDDVAYASTSSKTVKGKITYTRNLIAGIWNPIYLPFEAKLSTELYDVAEFDSAEDDILTLTKITDATATLKANTAYVIRPKAAETLTITLENATLEAANVDADDLGNNGFSVRGNYSVLKGEDLGGNDRIVSKAGEWAPLADASTLKPFRLILTIPAGTQAISMRVEGEDATSIENLGITIEGDVIYDLMGRRVETMTEGGIYIVNGKKIVF